MKKGKKEKINPKEDKYVIRKYVMAKSVADAIKKDKVTPVQGAWIDEDWLKKKTENACDAIGFTTDTCDDDDYYEEDKKKT